jgi:hypothetical protein
MITNMHSVQRGCIRVQVALQLSNFSLSGNDSSKPHTPCDGMAWHGYENWHCFYSVIVVLWERHLFETRTRVKQQTRVHPEGMDGGWIILLCLYSSQ